MSARSKTPLALMEQVIMVLVFALAAALCLWVFTWSDRTSKAAEAADEAALVSQSVAETLKYEGRQTDGDVSNALEATADRLGGNFDNDVLTLYYNGDWEQTDAPDAYVLQVTEEPAESGESDSRLGKATVAVTDASSGEEIFQIPIAWQRGVA